MREDLAPWQKGALVFFVIFSFAIGLTAYSEGKDWFVFMFGPVLIFGVLCIALTALSLLWEEDIKPWLARHFPEQLQDAAT